VSLLRVEPSDRNVVEAVERGEPVIRRFGLRMRIGLESLLRRFRAPRVSVLLYHRVTDDARDNLSVGIEQFDRQMAFVSRHCRVLSIEDVATGKLASSPRRPAVCVTFDDGYLDNYLHAVPILIKHGVTAGFFVSTGIVTSQGDFPHDVERGNPRLPVMTWDQLREMRDAGFTIGSHSVNHIDCASESEEVVRRELTESKETLRRELGQSDCFFAYPYGGPEHMTPERLELVKQAGYSACLSAYGGINVGAVDPFNVLRGGLHYEFSDLAFRARCHGV